MGGLPLDPGITNSAGWLRVAPPTGIIASARCRPGVSSSWANVGIGRATVVGEYTILTRPPIVPLSVGRIG